MAERKPVEMGVVIWMMEKLGADVVENVLGMIDAEKESIWTVTLDRVPVKPQHESEEEEDSGGGGQRGSEEEEDSSESASPSSDASIESINQEIVGIFHTPGQARLAAVELVNSLVQLDAKLGRTTGHDWIFQPRKSLANTRWEAGWIADFIQEAGAAPPRASVRVRVLKVAAGTRLLPYSSAAAIFHED